METEQLCEEEIKGLIVLNLYGSISRVRECSRDLVWSLENHPEIKGYQVIGFPHHESIREMVSRVNGNLNTNEYYKQIVDEKNLSYIIIKQ